MILVGNKIKKYMIITCPHCNESFRVDYRDIMQEFRESMGCFIQEFQCPWCEEEVEVEVVSPYNEYMYVRED